MKRIIKTFETCSDELLGQLAEKFPNGIKDRHLSNVTTLKGDTIRVVELQTDDAIYLIKFSKKLEDAIDNFDIPLEEVEGEIEIGADDDIDSDLLQEAEEIGEEIDMDDDEDDED